jgi:hypothetical protein
MDQFTDQSTTQPWNQTNGHPSNGSGNSVASSASSRIDGAALAAHQTVDKVADKATSHIDRLSGTAHRAVNSSADAAASAADWAAGLPEQAKNAKATASEAICNSIRSRPLTSVAGAIAAGYLLGRLARL